MNTLEYAHDVKGADMMVVGSVVNMVIVIRSINGDVIRLALQMLGSKSGKPRGD